MGSVKMELVSAKKPSPNFAMDIIDKIDSEETRYWEHMAKVQLYTFNLSLKSDEAIEILDHIADRAANTGTYEITRIERVQNQFLMAMYLLNKEALFDEYGKRVVRSNLLLHGTKRKNITDIVNDNFDVFMVERNRYGKGIYFTDDIMYASKFCNRTLEKKLIVAYVLESRTCTGRSDMEAPDEGTDTSFSRTNQRQNVIVKYDDDTFYPAYIVTFKVRF